MARRSRKVRPRREESVAALFWTYDGRDELTRRMTASLSKLTKEEIITLILTASFRWEEVCRHVLLQTEEDQPIQGLIGDIESWIDKATNVPKGMLNHNFHVDDEAYEEVRVGLLKLIRLGHLPEAMELSLQVLSSGSNQIDSSDEGLMADEVAQTIRVVLDYAESCQEQSELTKEGKRQMIAADYLGILSRPREEG